MKQRLLFGVILFSAISVLAQKPANYLQIISPASAEPGRYQAIEIGTAMPMLSTLTDETGKMFINPYAPEEVEVWATFTHKSDSRTVKRNAFYFEDSRWDSLQNKVITKPAAMPWRVRFAPPDTGSWECTMQYRNSKGEVKTIAGIARFRCVPSTEHGYLRTASDNMHLEFTDGAPFFAVGQNIAWPWTDHLYGTYGHYPYQFLGGYRDFLYYFNHLAACSGNSARVVPPRWSLFPECGPCGDYSAGQSRMAIIDSMMEIAEKRGIYIQFVLQLQHHFGVNLSKDEVHPCVQQLKKPGEKSIDLLTNDSLKMYLERYARYAEARWGYSPHIFSWEMFSEVQHWEGYRDDVKGARAKFDAMITDMGNYIKKDLGDTLHMLSISEESPNMLYENKLIDYADIHRYDNDFNVQEKRFDLINNRKMRSYDKPVHIGELGMINGPVNNCDAEDIEGCNDISFHNAVWSVGFMGDFGVGFNWAQWNNDNYRIQNFSPFQTFYREQIRDLRNFTPHYWNTTGLETCYMRSAGNDTAYGWIHNRSYWWGNLSQKCRDRNGKSMLMPRDDDKDSIPGYYADKPVVLSGFAKNTEFVVRYYDTRSGRSWPADEYTVKSSRRGKIKLTVKSGPDFAFTLRRKPMAVSGKK